MFSDLDHSNNQTAVDVDRNVPKVLQIICGLLFRLLLYFFLLTTNI